MRVAVVAGPDPGHSFPAIALCQRFRAAADTPTLFTGVEWLEAARAAGIDAVELDGLAATDRDLDAGARIHRRAAQMAVLNVPRLRALEPELVVSDVITACGGMAAELLGIPWVELNPHPLTCRRRDCRRSAADWLQAPVSAAGCAMPPCER